jgi:hypothetical protein
MGLFGRLDCSSPCWVRGLSGSWLAHSAGGALSRRHAGLSQNAGTTTRGSVSEVARIKQPAIVSVFGESAEPTSLSATMAGPITRLRMTRSRTTARDPHIDLALRQVNRSSEASRPPVRYKP